MGGIYFDGCKVRKVIFHQMLSSLRLNVCLKHQCLWSNWRENLDCWTNYRSILCIPAWVVNDVIPYYLDAFILEKWGLGRSKSITLVWLCFAIHWCIGNNYNMGLTSRFQTTHIVKMPSAYLIRVLRLVQWSLACVPYIEVVYIYDHKGWWILIRQY